MINQEPPLTGRNRIPSNWKRSSPGILSIFFCNSGIRLAVSNSNGLCLTKFAHAASALAEIIIVVTIIALLAATTIPALFVRENTGNRLR